MKLRFGQTIIAGDARTGIIYDRYDNQCEARIDGEAIRFHPAAVVCDGALAKHGVHLVWSFVDERPADFVAALPIPAPIALALPAEPVTVTERHNARRPRCCHYKAIRRAFAIAREQRLDTRADEAMRAAFGRFLGRSVGSRDELSGGDWMLLGDAMKMRRLCW